VRADAGDQPDEPDQLVPDLVRSIEPRRVDVVDLRRREVR
jgi:hypothetical protein